MKDYLPYIFAVLAGLFTTMEASINANLGKMVTPKIATLHSLVTGVLVILLANLVNGTLNQYLRVFKVSPRWLIGGVFGTLIIYLVTKTIPKIGITTTLTIVIASQILSSLYIESFITGQQQFNLFKLLGVVFLLVGIYIIVE